MRLIDADKAYTVLADYYHIRSAIQHMGLREALERVPTYNPGLEKCGRWQFVPATRYESEGYRCSYCGRNTVYSYRYCPNCGSRNLLK